MMTDQTMTAVEYSDAQLVARSLAGDRDAFGRIVSKYQVLICSLAYNRLGNLGQSEDVAQETFITAWRHLRHLRQPAKLRAWLCGILRNRLQKSLHREGRELAHNAEPLEAAENAPAHGALPSEQTITREEQAILWRSLERIPETYREPLILFYREHQSIESVAAELELSQDAVKQRLSRGRKLLQEEVTAFVESALGQTAPGQAFSVAVLAALPTAAGTAATAGAGASAKGTAAAKSGFLGAWLAPFIGIAGGLLANWLVVRAAPTAHERRVKKVAFVALWVFVLGWALAGQFAARTLSRHLEWSDRTFFAVMAGFWWFYAIVVVTLSIVTFRRVLAIRQQSEECVETRQAAITPMKPGVRLGVVVGTYLGFFSGLIYFAWRADDLISAMVITATMTGLGIWHFLHLRGQAGAAAMRAVAGHLAFAWAIILVILNWRLEVWIASLNGIDQAGMRRLLPVWVIPLLSLALVLWAGVLLAMTRPRPHGGCEKGGGNSAKKNLLLMALAGCFLAFGCPTTGQSQTVSVGKLSPAEAAIPDQFRALNRELAETLRQASQLYPFQKGKARPLVAPDLSNLFWATGVFGSAASHSQPWQDVLATLDAFKAMGTDGVSVMIAAPFLATDDSGSRIDFYRRLASEIHSRRMKLYVEHFIAPPFSPLAFKGLHDDPQGKKEFLGTMEKEIALIYREVKPDYLSLVTEPETLLRWTHLTFSADELANWIGETATHLKSTGASPNTLLGAGAGTWESGDFILKFARQTNLDYADFHLYALKLNSEDQVEKLAPLVRKVREVRPNMRVTIGEAWLFKNGADEPKGMFNREAFFRDNFGFWSPLDEQFLNLLMGLAQKKNISVVAPYFSQYFFACYTFGDEESSKLPPWPGSVAVSWNKALQSVRNHQRSPTGEAMSAMLEPGGK